MLVENKRLFCYAFLWGIPLAISCVLGWRLVHEGTVFGGGGSAAAYVGSFLLFLLETAVLSVPSAAFAAVVLRGGIRKCRGRSPGFASGKAAAGTCGMAFGKTQRMGNAVAGKESPAVGYIAESSRVRRPAWQIWIFYSLLICFCWLPIFLAYYPSVFAYDAEGQLYQVLASDYSTHHPLLHTLFLGAFFRLGGMIGSYSAGMAVHSIVQMLLMAGAFALVLTYLYEKETARWQRLLLLAFYALFPTNSVLALSTTKDVLFSAFVLLYTMTLYHRACDRKEWMEPKQAAACVILSILLLLFRNNAVYAFLVSIPFVYAGCRKWCGRGGDGKQAGVSKQYLLLSLTALLCFAVCSTGLRMATHAHSGSPREMLSVPLQQMARTRVMEEQQIEPALRQELEKYIPSEWVFAAYDPHLADPVKNRAVIHDDPVGLIKTWVRLGIQHPAVYIDAFLDNGVGYWYLEDISHAQIYGIGTASGFGYLSTDNRTMPAGCEIVPRSYLPGLRGLMEKIVSDNEYQRIPVLRIVFAPAFYWWMLCMYIAVAVYRRKYVMVLPVCFLTAYYFTLLLSPTVLIRYMYPFVVTVPAICCCMSRDCLKNDSENIQ